MTRPKKFPTILLIFTLVFAIFVTGVTKPGFLLPLFRPNIAEPAEPTGEPPTAGSIEGNSRAFNITADTGFSISAAENALDHDRTFSVSRIGDDVLRGFQNIAFGCEDIDIIPMIGWKVDADMQPEDRMRGVFNMDFDLSQFGIPEELFRFMTVYHIDDDGMWDEYATELRGSNLHVEASHNGLVVLGIAITARKVIWTLVTIGGAIFVNKFINNPNETQLMNMEEYDVYEYDEVVEIKHTDKGDMPVLRTAGKKIYKLKFSLSPKMVSLQKTMEEIEISTYNASAAEAIASMKRDYGEDYMSDPNMKYAYALTVARQVKIFVEKLGKDNDYIECGNSLKAELDNNNYTWESAHKMAELVRYAHYYLRDIAKVKVPTDCPVIFMNPGISNAKTSQYIPSMRSFAAIPTSGLGRSEPANSKILSTLTHEMSHMCQREYCTGARSSPKYDEACSQLLEEQACDWYMSHTMNITGAGGVVTVSTSENGSLMKTRPSLENGIQFDFYAVGMNNSSSDVWLSSEADKFTTFDKSNMEGNLDTADLGYPYARFIEYLWKKYEKGGTRKMTWHKLFGAYWLIDIKPSMGPLLKSAFGYWEHDLTRRFKDFAEENKTKFFNISKDFKGRYFSPSIGLSNQNGGRVNVKNEDYTIRTRFFNVYVPDNYNKQASLLVAQDEGFRSTFTDRSFIPVGNTDCETCKHGLFYPPQSVESLKKGAVIEVDGGTQGVVTTVSNWFSFSKAAEGYSLWTMLAPDEITPEIKNGQLWFRMPEMSEVAKKNLVDGYRVTITASTNPERPVIEYYTLGIAGQERSINLDRLISEDLIKRAEEDESGDTVSFTVSVCEYIKDQDGKVHYGPESNPRNSMNALLAEMGAHEGRITITLHWYGHDDLDLHCITPQGGHISYSNKEADGGYLDVDMNISGDRTESVEHIYFDQPDAGDYQVYIVNYTDRTEGDHNAEIYISVEGRQIIADTASMGSRSKTWKFRTTSAVLAESGGQYLVAEPLASVDPPAR